MCILTVHSVRGGPWTDIALHIPAVGIGKIPSPLGYPGINYNMRGSLVYMQNSMYNVNRKDVLASGY